MTISNPSLRTKWIHGDAVSGLIRFAHLYSMKTWILPSLDADMIWARITAGDGIQNLPGNSLYGWNRYSDFGGNRESVEGSSSTVTLLPDTIKATDSRPCLSSDPNLI